MSNILKPLPVS